jgi:acyl-CoA synthetase (AMP-forming)/AMP-acid ligase II
MSQSLYKLPSEFTTLVDLLRHKAEKQPEQKIYTFLLDGEKEFCHWTYSDLEGQARKIAALLKSYRVEGQRILLLYPPGLDYIAAFFGCLYAGAIAVPAYPPHNLRRAYRVQKILQDSEAAITLTTSKILPLVKSLLSTEVNSTVCHWLTTDNLPASIQEICRLPHARADSLAFLQPGSDPVWLWSYIR